ncbi:Ig-like domain-containing protein [Bacillus toyonensis]|uniref:Ig-like domain-containing protein n=1 Tax=Bacillus toyonensis TaxID=155322 RepID=UPI0021D04E4C|nr:Ig-like domain-containing protein [Bacillus toyonensis]MCU4771019.1 Ig-like domain-containing protein [Bacillus toyonensis]MCU5582885.1 Ig-like domain-containing protein [Bacillus toyonensis]
MNTSNQFNPPILFIPKEKECYEKRISVLVSIKIDPKTLSLCSSLSHQFTATGTYSDKSTRDITKLVEWYSSNLSSAIVSNEEETKGLTTAINTGEAQIFARLDGIMSSDSCLTVTEPVVQMTNLKGSNDYTLDINKTVSTTETTSMYCPSRTFGFGKGVLLLENDVASYDFAKQLWSLTQYTVVQISPSIIKDQYTTGKQLAADYWCVWIGIQGNITDLDVMEMMQPGGIIDEFVKLGGIFIVHDTDTNPIIVTSSEGLEFIGGKSESLTQFSKLVQIPLSFEYLRTYLYINSIKKEGDSMALETNCETCTPPEGSTSILTVDIPGGLAINLLGIHIEACPICVTVFTDGSDTLTSQQQDIANNLIKIVQNLVPNIPGA